MRLIVARCEVTYTGRLSAYLPECRRVCSWLGRRRSAGARRRRGLQATGLDNTKGVCRGVRSSLIIIQETAGTTRTTRDPPRRDPQERAQQHDMGEAAGLEKDGSTNLQLELAAQPHAIEDELPPRPAGVAHQSAVRPDLHDSNNQWVAVEIKRIATGDAVRAAVALPGADPARPGDGLLARLRAAQKLQARRRRRSRTPRGLPGRSTSSSSGPPGARPDALRVGSRFAAFLVRLTNTEALGRENRDGGQSSSRARSSAKTARSSCSSTASCSVGR